MDASQQALLAAIQSDTSKQLAALKTDLTSELNTTMTKAIDKSEAKMNQKMQDRFDKHAAANKSSLSGVTSDINKKIENITKEVDKLKVSNSSGSGYVQDPWHVASQASKKLCADGRVPIPTNRAVPPPPQPYGEENTKKQRTVKVIGFIGNTDKITRIKLTRDFIDKLGMVQNLEKVDAYGTEGREAVIIFTTKEAARQFIMDNKEQFAEFKPPGIDGDEKKMRFSLYPSPTGRKVENATRLLSKLILASKYIAEDDFKYSQYAGTISYKKFPVIYVKCNQEFEVKYVLDRINLKEINEEGFEAKLEESIRKFKDEFQ